MSRNRVVRAFWLPVLAAFAAPAETFQYPIGVAVDAKGQIYVSDQDASSIFLVSPDRKISVLARGNAEYRSPLYRVRGIAVDPQGQIIAADPASSEVYRIGADGKATPLAGGKLAMPMDVAIDPKGDIVVADHGDEAIYRIVKGGAPQHVAKVPAPRALAAVQDGSLVVISSRGLVRVTAAGKVEAITAKDAFEFPGFVAVTAAGNYVVSDGYAQTIWKVGKDGKVAPLAKGSPLVNPQGIAIGPKGEVLVADPHAKAILVVSPTGQITTLVKL